MKVEASTQYVTDAGERLIVINASALYAQTPYQIIPAYADRQMLIELGEAIKAILSEEDSP